ncbi:tRNA dimethylallyltransferase 2 [Iris pallida]|uniref:tRNA dimethylallyltransferase 2 n=1 Tax=Iris pallida TaxID=29817 RepID=A0AAX6IQ83_IRIPA|nr:tRNA dimethylallyltransferase 2 [Iris pallida]
MAGKKVVVIMGATGSGKSRLAIDLAVRLSSSEIVSADSMQVYRGLDVLTNKVPLPDRNGVRHHLLGTVDASLEFTSKDFRDLAVPIVDDILSRNCLPVVVGGTNYYIQALVTPFLVDDLADDMAAACSISTQDVGNVGSAATFERLKEIDPVAANRIHPNDHRKINRYLSLYASSGVLPSTLFQEQSAEKWGRVDSFRYNCCFIWLDVSLPVLDRYVDQRVDCMIDAGLLDEVYDIYKPNADYTRGLRQAIGVREFEEFFTEYFSRIEAGYPCLEENGSNHNAEMGIRNIRDNDSRPNLSQTIGSIDDRLKILLDEAVDKLKANTRKLARRQIRRLNRLKTYFGWDLHYFDATEAFLCNAGDLWNTKVVEPSVDIVKTFLFKEAGYAGAFAAHHDVQSKSRDSRDLWSQYVCEACGNQILRGAHEWEQHRQGRGHRKRVLRLKKRHQIPLSAVVQHHIPTTDLLPSR